MLAQQISQITGVAQVIIGGEQKPAVRVQVDPAKLATQGLTLEDVRGVIATATGDAAKGTHQRRDAQASPSPPTTSSPRRRDYDDVILAYRNGAPVRVRDIGHAVDGPENVNSCRRWDERQAGGPACRVQAARRQRHRDRRSRSRPALPRLQAVIPPAVRRRHQSTARRPSARRSHDVEFTLVLTIGLVVLVILLFLRNLRGHHDPEPSPCRCRCSARAAVMYVVGFSLDNLSLMALTIAVGFVVDDAIVVVENIYRHIEDGMAPIEAALKGAREIGFTVLSISISLVAVFIPLLLMGGIVGRLFREFAMTVTAAIAVSAFVSLTLTPMLCSRFLRHENGRARPRLPRHRGRLRRHARRLPAHARHRAAAPVPDAVRVLRHDGADRLAVRHDPEGLLPDRRTPACIIGVAEAAQDVSSAR